MKQSDPLWGRAVVAMRFWVAIAAVAAVAACGGGSGSSGASGGTQNPPPGSTTTVQIAGSLSHLAKAQKPSADAVAAIHAASGIDWAGATLQVIDASGAVVGAATPNADGTYTVSVPPGSNYFIRVQTGNLVLKAFVPSVTADTSVDVTSATTAEVIVLAQVLGVTDAGEPGVSVSAPLSSVNVEAVVMQLEANPNVAVVAAALSANIGLNYDADSSTPAIGAADSSVSATIVSIALVVSTTSIPPAPSVPQGVGVTAGDGQTAVVWNPVSGATHYNVYYRAAANVTTANGTKAANAASGGAIAGLANGTTYYFVVTAQNAGGESAVSSEVSATPQVTAPGAPTGVSATAGDGQVVVSWAAAAGAASYNIYYGTASGVTPANGTKAANAASGGAITGLANGTTYYFVVTAQNAGGESAVSSEVSATPQVPAPGTPAGVTVTGGDAQATVSWTAVAGATSYNVYYGTAAGVTAANGTKVAGATSGGAITGLANGTTYYFVVTAQNAGGESAVSSKVSATPQVPAPGTPAGVTVTGGDAQATVSWSAVASAASYNVYYSTASGVTPTNGTKVAGATSGGAITGLANGVIYYFVVTAKNAGGESPASAQVWAKPASLGAWTTKTAIPATNNTAGAIDTKNERDNAANVVLNGKVYVLGGAPAGTGILDTMVAYDPATDTWAEKALMPAWSAAPIYCPWLGSAVTPRYRYGPAAAAVNGYIYLIGGTSLVNGGGPIYPIAVYDPVGNSWSPNVPGTGTPLAPIPTGRWGFDVAVIDGKIYAVGGAVQVNGGVTPANGTKVAGATSGGAITGLTNGKNTSFIVTAVDALGNESAASYEVSATPQAAYTAGAIPANLGSIAGDTQVTLNWTGVTGATSYNVYWDTKPGVTVSSANNSTGIATTNTTVTGLTNGAKYYFIVTAMNGTETAASIEVSTTPQAAPAASVPSNVAITGGNGQVTLTWTAPAGGASSYNVYYSTTNNIYYGNVEVYDPVANTWTAKTPMPTPRWGSAVSVVNGLIYAIGGWGGWPELSLVEVYDPATDTWSTTVPANPATTALGTAGAALAPMPTARDDFGFAVLNGVIYAIGGDINAFSDATLTPCCTTVVEAYDTVTNTWSAKTAMPTIRDDFDASVVDGVIYGIAGSRDGKFTVRVPPLDPAWLAANDGGFSLTTNEAFSISAIPVPGGLAATAGVNQVSLSWNAVAGATSYNIYWSNKAGVSSNSNSTKITNGSATTYTHTGLTAGTWYYYIVTAVTSSGESLPSNEIAVKP